MIRVNVKQMTMDEYLALGFTHVECDGVKYQIITPAECDIPVEKIHVGSGFRFWGLKTGEASGKHYAIPIYPPVPTNSERIEDGQETY